MSFLTSSQENLKYCTSKYDFVWYIIIPIIKILNHVVKNVVFEIGGDINNKEDIALPNFISTVRYDKLDVWELDIGIYNIFIVFIHCLMYLHWDRLYTIY